MDWVGKSEQADQSSPAHWNQLVAMPNSSSSTSAGEGTQASPTVTKSSSSCKTQVTHRALDPLASDIPNAGAYSSASTLPKRGRPTTATPALDDFRISLSPAQSESGKTVTSDLMSPNSINWIHSLSLQEPVESLQFGKDVHRILVEFALSFTDSEQERQRVEGRAGTISLPLLSAACSWTALDTLCRTCTEKARFDYVHALQLLLEL